MTITDREEAQRLSALHGYGLLDLPADEELQAVLRLAAVVAGVPTAVLNLVDTDRQHQLATVGAPARDCARTDSMCAAVLTRPTVVHVPDARADVRFAANPWVDGALGHIRFYASVPLLTSDGHALGRLCVWDVEPRVLSDDQQDRLLDLGTIVMALFERHRAVLLQQQLAAAAEARHQLTRTVLDTVDVGIVAADEHGRLTLMNRTSRRWHGLDADPDLAHADLPGRYSLFEADGTTPLPSGRVPLVRTLAEGSVDTAEIVIAPPGRPPVTVIGTGRSIFAADGSSLGAVVVMQDVTESRRRDAALRASEQRFRSAFDNAPHPAAVLAPDDTIADINPAFCAWLGHRRADLLGVSVAAITHPEDLAACAADRRAVREGVVGRSRSDKRYLHRRGGHVWGRQSLAALAGPDGETQVICQVEDITEQRASEQRLTHLALHDPLTGLANRALLQERLDHALALSQRGDDRHAVLFCDLNSFKAVNDTHGHAVGDEVLVAVAARLSEVLRPSDTVARLGGDEFVVLCESLTDPGEAERVAARLRRAVTRPVPTSVGLLRVDVSVGVSWPTADRSAADALQEADRRMYEAKSRQRLAVG